MLYAWMLPCIDFQTETYMKFRLRLDLDFDRLRWSASISTFSEFSSPLMFISTLMHGNIHAYPVTLHENTNFSFSKFLSSPHVHFKIGG